MNGKSFTEEQITCALRQAEGGAAVADVCRQRSISEACFYPWKKKFVAHGMTEMRAMCQLRDETARLKRLVANPAALKNVLSAM